MTMVLLAACAAPADTGVPAEAPPAEEEMPEEPGGGGDVHVPAAEQTEEIRGILERNCT